MSLYSRLRVAHVGTYNRDSADGTEKTVAGLVGWLPAHGVDVEVWQPVRGLAHVRERQVDGVRIWDLPAHVPPGNFVRPLPAETTFFVRSRQQHVDLVHFHSGFVPEHVAIARHVGVPYVIAPNGGYSPANLRGRDWWFKQGWLRLRETTFVRRAALVHAVSEGEQDALHAQFRGVRSALVPNALDLTQVPLTVVGAQAPLPWLLFLGRLAVEQKGLDVLVQGYRQFLDTTGDTSTRLVFVGPDYRGGKASLEHLVVALELNERVEFRPPVFGQDKWALLKSVHALVHPSRWDGLPFTVLEALAASRPVLVAPGTNVADLVEAYSAGVVVRADPTDVARGLGVLTGMSEEQRAAMGRGGRQMVEDHFAWPEAARRMAEAYRAIAA
jgi:glycosyltransferase involved in cell wall biosynthesis